MSGDLRAAVEGLWQAEENVARHTGHPFDSIGYSRACYDVLALIPQGAVLINGSELDELRGQLEAKNFEVLALHEHPPLPEGAVLVTEETLNAAIHASHFHGRQMVMTDAEADAFFAAAILRHLRKGTE